MQPLYHPLPHAHLWLISLLILNIIGLWKPYFSIISSEDILFSVHIHGISMFSWIVMLIIQSWLIKMQRNQWHRILGIFSFPLFLIIIVSGIFIAIQGLGRNYDDPLSGMPLGTFYANFAFLLLFAMFYISGIYNRKDVELHARYMLATAQVFVIASMVRIIIFYFASVNDLETLSYYFYVSMLIGTIVPLALIANDKMKGKVYPPFVYLAIAYIILIVVGYKVVPDFDWWRSFAAWSLELDIGSSGRGILYNTLNPLK